MSTRDYVVILDSSAGGISSVGYYEFIGDGGNIVRIKDNYGEDVLCNLSLPLIVFISGTARPTNWYTGVNDGTGTSIILSSPRVFPNNAPCSIMYYM